MRNIYEKYGYYLDAIKKISRKPISSMPLAKKVGVTKAMMQMSYREMRELRFPGSTVDYIIWVGGMYELNNRITETMAIESDDRRLKLFSSLESSPLSAAILSRGVWFIRVADLEDLNPDPYTGLRIDYLYVDAINWLMEFSRLLEAVQLGDKSEETRVKSEKLGCSKLISDLVIYQWVKPDSDSSSKPPTPQPPTKKSKQNKKPSAP